MAKKMVLALGGNALGDTPESQLMLVRHTAKMILDLFDRGYHVIIGHGNGPQVGMINLAMDLASVVDEKLPYIPMPECGAMSQGYIGYHLQQALREELGRRGRTEEVATIITQVIVDPEDVAFEFPSKPIGRFYTKEEAQTLALEKQFTFVEDAGRGYRRVVASPQPKEIVELNIIRQLEENGDIVITVGGGGIPVIRTENGLAGVTAVIDKDKSSAKLAEDLHADLLVILTAVDRVCINYNTPDQKEIAHMTAAQAQQYIEEKQFAPGSMLPKIEACLQFVRHNPEGKAIITSLDHARQALHGETGTVITAE